MNRVDRLMAMVVQLQSKRVVRAEDIAAHFEISVRTVYRDFSALSEAGIPIVAEPGVGYGLVKGYHLPPVMFTAEEASALSLGGKLVDHLTDASLSKQMGSALHKIRSVLPRDRQDYLDRLERSTIIVAPKSADANPQLASETLIPIQRALAERRVLTIEYQGKERPEITHRHVEPLGLVYYADHWHLVAFCRLRRDVRDFRTDRISHFELKSEVFPPHENFSLKNHLESCKENKFAMAYLRFNAGVMDRVRRESYCGVIEEKPDGNDVMVTMLACTFDWLAGWMLSFGESAEVLAPRELRDRVAGEARKIAARYDGSRQIATLQRAA